MVQIFGLLILTHEGLFWRKAATLGEFSYELVSRRCAKEFADGG